MTAHDALAASSDAAPGERLRRYHTICARRGGCQRVTLTGSGSWTFCPDCLTLHDCYGVSANPVSELSVATPLDLFGRGEQCALCTSPLFTRDSRGCLFSVGTGVFVDYSGRSFVLTASHVLREYMPLLTGGRTVVSLTQSFFTSADENQQDVGFVPLTDEQRASLSDVRFLTADDIDLSNDVSSGLHYIVGYRADDNAQDSPSRDVIAGWSVYGVKAASSEVYEQRHLPPSESLLLTFDRQRLSSPMGIVDVEPEPEGLSGSGVWHITSTIPASDRLVGLVESHTDSGRLIYAARLRRVLEGLRLYVAGELPSSP